MTAAPRRCVVCRKVAPRGAFARFVAENARVALDALSVKPGRGAYVCISRRCLRAATTRGLLGRRLRAMLDATGGDPLERWQREAKREFVVSLDGARRAGWLVEAHHPTVGEGEPTFVLHAEVAFALPPRLEGRLYSYEAWKALPLT